VVPVGAIIVAMGILDNAKEIANSVHEIKNLELYARVLNLHSDIIQLVEDNNRLRAENGELNKKLQLREKMAFKEPFYFQDGDETPYCPSCWETKSFAIHVVFVFNRDDAIRWDCPSCKTTYMEKKDRRVMRPHKNEPPSTPWG
jgi:hypothetical protein